MATPFNIPLTHVWLAIASGPGQAAFCPIDAEAEWTVGSNGQTPAQDIRGLPAPRRESQFTRLEDGETVFLRGRGILAGTATSLVE
ncbi:hypothetical protein [Falsirhodobacter sp. 20TX0035]|uniref:hypothetical protein n=1 Tax=Falsirhodobacter sp. 20TX0035 TaxID=3022019 RepID=UPI002330FBEB|nr:hypothetical protein [Falsirhodobacter sp. 20TX0035]MDB6454275.1 hypothetical protein [Falsirhodobacter sp. 20TX0035]